MALQQVERANLTQSRSSRNHAAANLHQQQARLSKAVSSNQSLSNAQAELQQARSALSSASSIVYASTVDSDLAY
jgi:hypothetical protein